MPEGLARGSTRRAGRCGLARARRAERMQGAAAEGGDAGMAWLRGGALRRGRVEAARGVRWHGVAAVELERGEMDGSGMRAADAEPRSA